MPDEGALRHGDEPVSDPAELQRITSVVFQDFVRSRLSALDNITFGRPEAPADEARAREVAGRADGRAGSAGRGGAVRPHPDALRRAQHLLISDRFSTVRNADRIYVLRDGEVVESGDHEALMHDDGT